ncbi:MAG: cation:proton antiporter, partial [Flavisolibacter sp.]
MDGFAILTLLIVLTAVFSYINNKFIKLPSIIGIMFLSLLFSLIIVLTGEFQPAILHIPSRLVGSIDFEAFLMKFILSFLLFAGAVHIDVHSLRKEMVPIISFATISVLISTILIGASLYWIMPLFGYQIDFIYCLLFGALISPTDPVAVLGILKSAGIPSSLEMKITGEALFNDGVGVVVFISIMDIASSGNGYLSVGQITWLFIRE